MAFLHLKVAKCCPNWNLVFQELLVQDAVLHIQIALDWHPVWADSSEKFRSTCKRLKSFIGGTSMLQLVELLISSINLIDRFADHPDSSTKTQPNLKIPGKE